MLRQIGNPTINSNWQLSPAVFNLVNHLLGLFHRPIWIQDQLSSFNILQLETRSRSTDYRCLLNVMCQQITISVPTILSDWEGFNEDPERISGWGLPYCTSLACSASVRPFVVNAGRSPPFYFPMSQIYC